MAADGKSVQVYEELADWHERQGQPQKRDRFLLLAADAALSAGNANEAERLRGRLLEVNPHHLLRPYRSLTEALLSPDVHNYVADLRLTHKPDEAERLLHSLHGEKAPDRQERPIRLATEEPARPTADSLKVYRVKIEEEESRPIPHSSPVVAAAPAFKSPPAPTAPSRPAPPPSRPPAPPRLPEADPLAPFRQPRSPQATRPADADDDELSEPTWVPTLLFWVVLGLGLLVLGYVLILPLWTA